MSEVGDGLQMLVLMSESLTGSKFARVEVLGRLFESSLKLVDGLAVMLAAADFAVVSEQLLEILGSEDVDLGKKEFALDQSCVAIIQNSPDRDQIFQLSSGLLDNAVLAGQDDGHARQVLHLGVAHNQRVNVEASGSENTREAREHTRLVLDQTVEDVTLRRRHGGSRRLIENVGDGGLG